MVRFFTSDNLFLLPRLLPTNVVELDSSRGAQVCRMALKRGSDLSEEGAVELDDVWTVAAPHHHVKIHQQLLLLLLVHSGSNPLMDTQQKDHSDFPSLLPFLL